jgi:hypothetical protein
LDYAALILEKRAMRQPVAWTQSQVSLVVKRFARDGPAPVGFQLE